MRNYEPEHKSEGDSDSKRGNKVQVRLGHQQREKKAGHTVRTRAKRKTATSAFQY